MNLKRYFNLEGDRTIWAITFLLMLSSILVVYSATGALAYKQAGGNTWYYFFRHSIFLIFGFLFSYIVHIVPSRYFSRLGQIAFYISILLLVHTLIAGLNINNASRWISIGGQSLQTSDIAKLSLIMFLSRKIIKSKYKLNDLKFISKHLFLPLTIICALIFPANFSTSALVMITSLCLFFLAGVHIKHLILYTFCIIFCSSVLILIAIQTPYLNEIVPRANTWVNRVQNYTKDKQQNTDDFYQVTQAKIALVNGGIYGRGPGKSIQRNTLPHPYSDYIYAIIIEEYGLIGGIFVLLLYMILLLRGRLIFNNSNNSFGGFLAIGLTISLVLQALVNMAVAVDFFPVTGQTLPLVSMGGTSIIFTCITIGIILSVSRDLKININ